MKLHVRRGALLALLALSTLSFSQTYSGPFSLTGTGCVSVGVDGQAQVAMNISGSWSGTIQPEASISGQSPANVQVVPSTSSTAASTITGNGLYTATVAGYQTFYLCGNTVTGTATVYFSTTQRSASGRSSGGGGSSGVTSFSGDGTIFNNSASTGAVTASLANTPTGSGGVVLATSPTLVTPALGTPSAVVLTNGTALPESGVTNLTSDLALKAPLASPSFTGTPSLPTGSTGVTQTAGDNSTKLSTTAYTDSGLATKAALPAASYALFPFVINSTTGSVTTNQVRCTNAVNNQATITATHIAFEITALQAATHAGVAIYSASGSTKIADSGAQDSSTASVKTATVSSFTLVFGTEYRTCMTADGATPPTFRTANTSNVLLNNVTVSAQGTAANAGSAGVMPSTTGAITGSATANVALVLVY